MLRLTLRMAFDDRELLRDFVDRVFPGAAFGLFSPAVLGDGEDASAMHAIKDEKSHIRFFSRWPSANPATLIANANAMRTIFEEMTNEDTYEPFRDQPGNVMTSGPRIG